MLVIKSHGEKEPFSFKKVYNSARKAGASRDIAKRIAERIAKEVRSETDTLFIYKKVREYLKQEQLQYAIKFSIKEAMKKLGPDGFIFEQYIKNILEEKGFKVKTNQTLKGKCIEGYEIDIIADKGRKKYLGECKYRNLQGDRVDINIALKMFAVMEDLGLKKDPIIITNAKFTNYCIKYSQCKKIELLGWKYPKKQGLESIIEERKLYPITILPSFKAEYLNLFVKEDLLLVKNIFKKDLRIFSRKYKIPSVYLHKLVSEAEQLL